MLNYVIERGVESEDVFLDHAGFSTYESISRARSVFDVNKALVVTQEYHLYRTVFDARSYGIQAYVVVAKSMPFIEQQYYSMREYIARVKDLIYSFLKPDPIYLGDKIDLRGSGEVTRY